MFGPCAQVLVGVLAGHSGNLADFLLGDGHLAGFERTADAIAMSDCDLMTSPLEKLVVPALTWRGVA